LIGCRQRIVGYQQGGGFSYHRLLASEAVLGNAHKVALTAAAAWGKEAAEAEAREEIALKFLQESDEEDQMSTLVYISGE